MKKLLTIKEMFNDELTGYVDKQSSVSMVIDAEKDCSCSPVKTCAICKLISKHGLTDIPQTKK